MVGDNESKQTAVSDTRVNIICRVGRTYHLQVKKAVITIRPINRGAPQEEQALTFSTQRHCCCSQGCVSAAEPPGLPGHLGAEPALLLMPWVLFLPWPPTLQKHHAGNRVQVAVWSPKHKAHSLAYLMDAVSGFTLGSGPISSSLLVQGRWNSSSLRRPPCPLPRQWGHPK